MRKLCVLAVVMLAVSFCAMAQNGPKNEVFGGYSYFHADTGLTGLPSQNMNGWDGALTHFFNPYLGVTADFNGEYTSQNVSGTTTNVHLHNFLFGPTVAYRRSKIRPFAHALFGVSHLSGSTDDGTGSVSIPSDNSFAMAFGGGADLKVARVIDVRLGQLDYVRTEFGSTSQNHLRYATGVVFRF